MTIIDPNKLKEEVEKLEEYLNKRALSRQERLTVLRTLVDYIRSKETIGYVRRKLTPDEND